MSPPLPIDTAMELEQGLSPVVDLLDLVYQKRDQVSYMTILLATDSGQTEIYQLLPDHISLTDFLNVFIKRSTDALDKHLSTPVGQVPQEIKP